MSSGAEKKVHQPVDLIWSSCLKDDSSRPKVGVVHSTAISSATREAVLLDRLARTLVIGRPSWS
ncbi:hypothetical protein GCM10020219_029780 [Nonomuraea dietziae]